MALLCCVTVSGCGQTERPLLERPLLLPDGEWVLVGRLGQDAVLAETPARSGARGVPRVDEATGASSPRVVLAAGGRIRPASVEMDTLSLPGTASARQRPLVVGRVGSGMNSSLVSIPGASPILLPSPAPENSYLFEESNALWLLRSGGPPRRLTADRVGMFDRGALEALQREGEVILYWAAAPLWSPDGETVAYVTNREAVLNAGRGQSIWRVNVNTGEERPVIEKAGVSFRSVGWFGAELLYIEQQPGLWAADLDTGGRRLLSPGTLVDVAADGSAIVIATGMPGATSLEVRTASASVALPEAEQGFGYTGQARVSPGGNRVIIESGDSTGLNRRFAVFDPSTRILTRLEVPAGLPAGPVAWVDEETVMLTLMDSGSARSWLIPVPRSEEDDVSVDPHR